MTTEFELAAVPTDDLWSEIRRRRSLLAERGERFTCTLTLDEEPSGQFHMRLDIPGGALQQPAGIMATMARDFLVDILARHDVDPNSTVVERIDHPSVN